MSWAQALKQYATETGKFVLPKKDTDEYKAVKAIQEKLATKQDEPLTPVTSTKPSRKAKGILPEGTKPPAAIPKETEKPIKRKVPSPALQAEQVKVHNIAKEVAKEESTSVKKPRAKKVVDSTTEKPPRKPRAKKIEIVQENVVMEF